MLAWCSILFMLGIMAFLDTIFNYGEIFRKVNSVFFMLVSLGLLVRTSMKMKTKRMEALSKKIEELEGQIHNSSVLDSSTKNIREKVR